MKIERGKILSSVAEPHVMFQLAAVVVMLIFWIGIFFAVHYENRAAQDRVAKKTHELADMYESHMVRNLGFIDQALKIIKYAYETRGHENILAELNRKEMLPPKLVFTVSIVNKTGKIIASTANQAHPSVTREAFFKLHERNDDYGPAINLVKSVGGKRKIQFSRRLSGNMGQFNGAVLISVDPDFFASDYEKIEYGSEGILGLAALDGFYLAKRKGDLVTSGEAVFSMPTAFSKIEDDPKSQPKLYFADGLKRLSVVKRIYGYPLTIVVALSAREQLLPAKNRTMQYLWVAGLVSIVFGSFAITVGRLLVQLNRAKTRSRRNQETYYAALESSHDAIFVLRVLRNSVGDAIDFAIEDLNERASTILGVEKKGIIGEKISNGFQLVGAIEWLPIIVDVFKSRKNHKTELEKNIPALGIEWLSLEIVHVEDGVVLVLRDITESKQKEAQIRHLAHHDPLTGLPNRTLLHDRLHQAILRASREARHVTVAFLDLDNFKVINDTLGHRIGDVLLKAVSARMLQCVRKVDSIIRYGGDEFVVIFEAHSENSHALDSVLARLREGIAQPVYVEGNKLMITSSIGLARYPDDGEEPSVLIQKADTAMYQVKTSGRNHFQYFVEGMKMSGDRLNSPGDVLPGMASDPDTDAQR